MTTVVLLSGCASAPLTKGGSLSSYENMTPSDGTLAKSLMRVSKDDVIAAKTVRIVPTVFSQAASPTLPDQQRMLVANAGREPGLVGMVAGGLGLPPEWSDKGTSASNQ